MTHVVGLSPSAKRCVLPCMLQAFNPLSDVIQIQVHSSLRWAISDARGTSAEPAECSHSAGGDAVVCAGEPHDGAAGALHAGNPEGVLSTG